MNKVYSGLLGTHQQFGSYEISLLQIFWFLVIFITTYYRKLCFANSKASSMSLPPEEQILKDRQEFTNALQEITLKSLHIDSVQDRVRCSQWICKLIEIPDDNAEAAKLKNDYIQYLRLMVNGGIFHPPFSNSPPESNLVPLPEYLVNNLSESIPQLPRVGPIAPVISHRSSDGRAYLSAQKIPGGGIFCYIAVTPDGFQ